MKHAAKSHLKLFVSAGIITTLILFSMVYSVQSQAHGRWLLPSHTSVTGKSEHAITLDMSISNDLFQGHYGFIQASKLTASDNIEATPASLDVIEPNGDWRRDIPFHWLFIRSSGFDVLDQAGTYHYVLNQPDVYIVIFKDKNGEYGRRFGHPEKVVLPKGATITKTMRYLPTIHTFVSRNKLTKPARLNKGLELVAKNHPNDLFANEAAEFEVYFQGKPLELELEVQVVKGNTRYRNQREQQTFHLKGSSEFSVRFPEAGMYLVEAELKLPSEIDGIELDRWAVFTTLEVNP